MLIYAWISLRDFSVDFFDFPLPAPFDVGMKGANECSKLKGGEKNMKKKKSIICLFWCFLLIAVKTSSCLILPYLQTRHVWNARKGTQHERKE
jgi:hypothetical protein